MAAPFGLFVARNRKRHRSLVVAIVAVLSLVVAQIAFAVVQGNIAPNSIEIDGPADAQGNVSPPGANLFPGATTCGQSFPSSGTLDWVKDCQANAGGTNPPGVVTGLVAGTTAASPVCASTPATFPATCATGHWNGVRIVDSVGNDSDIFVKGGKEQDVSTWNIAPGSVGSSKYDASQMYLANSQTAVFFGMERIGNNGSTAFDFEFNKNAPASTYVPSRSAGDVMVTFEMSGSVSSGGAVAHYFTYASGKYTEQTLPAGVQTSINDLDNTPGEPWGHVNDKGQWVLGTLDRFTVAEAAVPLSLLGFANGAGCNGNRYVQIRTRSSATDTSDLKDTTPIFAYSFGGPTAAATLSTDCATKTFANPAGDPTFTYDGTGSKDSGGGSSLTYALSIDVSPSNVTLSGGNVSGSNGHYTSTSPSGTVTVNLSTAGAASATITVKNTVNEGGCNAATGDKVVTVFRALSATATLTPHCNRTFDFAGTASGGKAPYTYAWTFQKNSANDGSGTWSGASGTVTSGSATSDSGTFVADTQGRYRALLTVKDTADTSNTDPQTGLPIDPDVHTKPQCSAGATSNEINVYDAVSGSVSLSPTCGHTFTFSASGSGGKAPYGYAFTLQKLVSGTWTTSSTWTAADSGAPHAPNGTIDIDNPANPPSGTNPGGALSPGGPGRYRLLVTISDSQATPCTVDLTSNEIEARDQLSVSIQKQSADSSNMSVTMSSTVGNAGTDTITYSWSKSTDNVTFSAIANSNSSTLTYSSFESDDSSPDNQTFTMNGDTYSGKVYVVWFKLTVTRTINGGPCSMTSTSIVAKKVIAVDP